MKTLVFAILALIISLPVAACAQTGGTATVAIQADHPGAVVSSNLFGIFFEEINYAGDGGLYAEMVRNRSFYDANNPLFWTLVTTGTATGEMNVDPTMPLNTNIPNSLKLTMSSGSGSVGAGNAGYWGMSLQAGATYDLSFYVRATNNFSGVISARLESADGSKVYSQAGFVGVNAVWRRFSAALVPSDTDTNARLVISISQPGTIWLGMVSLFPRATFNSRTNGLRADLANLLAALHPSFMRYPGGNFIESFN
ncbi:MAG TPA: carbohydrate binding domain-containing protein, partial [Verrucomicrobiae bacterium]|nr:carbohydrate binding domain-containing protein [Verrucomicrobiae bacterium]